MRVAGRHRVAVLLAPREDGLQFGLFVGLGLAIGILAPPAVLGKIARDRQARIRKALPDSLDLVLVCVEAGVSLDAALLRVAREMELLHLVADGLTNAEIAEKLVLAIGTVKKHLNNIFGKLDVGNRTQAIARARELELL